MRIPPYYHHPSWQRFIAGVIIGALISWLIFLYMFGVLQEEQAKIIKKQQDEIADLEKEKQIWQNDFAELNKKNKEMLTVHEIKVKIYNYERYNIDPLSVFEKEEEVKEDLNILLAKDLDFAYKSRDLIKRMIQNKTIRINDKRYALEIREIFIYTTLTIQLEIKLAN